MLILALFALDNIIFPKLIAKETIQKILDVRSFEFFLKLYVMENGVTSEKCTNTLNVVIIQYQYHLKKRLDFCFEAFM